MATYIVTASEGIRVALSHIFPAASGVTVITPEFAIPDSASNVAVILPPDIHTSDAASVAAYGAAVAARLTGTDIEQVWLGAEWSDGSDNDIRTLLRAEIEALENPA